MQDKNYDIFKILKEYYHENCAPLIFVGEKKLSANTVCKMYFADVLEEKELDNYKKVFQEYLALYVKSYDKLKYYSINDELTEEQVSNALVSYSKSIWKNSSLIITDKPLTLGIYGELFNDFYINIVKDEHILITYASKRGYEEQNVRGVDIIGCTLEDNNLTLIFSESKFVSSVYSASGELVHDIIGDDDYLGHVTKDYINRYMIFVVNKTHSIFSDRKDGKKILEILEQLNSKISNNEEVIDVINQLNIKIRFTFFAIYSDNKYTPDEREKYFMDVINKFNQAIEETGIVNYDIEIVFIPTKNRSVALKGKMIEWN